MTGAVPARTQRAATRLVRAGARGRMRRHTAAQHAATIRRAAPQPAPRVRLPSVVDVFALLRERPSMVALVGALLCAGAAHAAAARLGFGLHAQRAAARVEMAVAPSEQSEPEPEVEPTRTSGSGGGGVTHAGATGGAVLPAGEATGGAGQLPGFDVDTAATNETAVENATAEALEPARVLRTVKPVFPPGAQQRGQGGSVTVDIDVSGTGAISDVRVVRATPPGVFDDAAVRAVRQWTFAPARQGTATRATVVRQTVRFEVE